MKKPSKKKPSPRKRKVSPKKSKASPKKASPKKRTPAKHPYRTCKVCQKKKRINKRQTTCNACKGQARKKKLVEEVNTSSTSQLFQQI